MENSKNRKYQVTLSFAGEDRDYVEKVAKYLKENDICVFYDKYEEVNLWGKNLYEHLQKIYSEDAEYMVMFISKFYEKKLWSNHERKSAQERAFKEKMEYILPARFDETKIPGLMETIGYIDISNKKPEQFGELIVQKILDRYPEKKYQKINPIYEAAFLEIEKFGSVTIAITKAILSYNDPPEKLEGFLNEIIKKTNGYAKISLGSFAITCIGRFNIGYTAVENLLDELISDDSSLHSIGTSLSCIKNENALTWAHQKLINVIKNDISYNTFLQNHVDFILKNLKGEMIAYVLTPDRGPDNYNFDTLFKLSEIDPKPDAYIQRIQEWIYNGTFDEIEGNDNPNSVAPVIFYRALNELENMNEDHPLQELRKNIIERTISSLKSSDRKEKIKGLYHYYWMHNEGFIDFMYIIEYNFVFNGLDNAALELYNSIRMEQRTGEKTWDTIILAKQLGFC